MAPMQIKSQKSQSPSKSVKAPPHPTPRPGSDLLGRFSGYYQGQGKTSQWPSLQLVLVSFQVMLIGSGFGLGARSLGISDLLPTGSKYQCSRCLVDIWAPKVYTTAHGKGFWIEKTSLSETLRHVRMQTRHVHTCTCLLSISPCLWGAMDLTPVEKMWPGFGRKIRALDCEDPPKP